jgi:hypothetical protein
MVACGRRIPNKVGGSGCGGRAEGYVVAETVKFVDGLGACFDWVEPGEVVGAWTRTDAGPGREPADVSNTVMSAPVSAMITSAALRETPGMVPRNSLAARKGSVPSSILSVSASTRARILECRVPLARPPSRRLAPSVCPKLLHGCQARSEWGAVSAQHETVVPGRGSPCQVFPPTVV